MSVPPKLGAMARMRAAMAKLKPTPGDAKSDLLVVIASRLIMNSGNPVRVSDVLNASSCAPADAWAWDGARFRAKFATSCPPSAAPRSLHRFHARQGYRIASGGRALSLPNRGRRMARPKPRNRRVPQRHTSSQSKGCVAPTTWQFLSFYSVP